MLANLQEEHKEATKIFCDNKAAASMTKNLMFHSGVKRINICYHFIRGLVAKEEIIMKYYSIQEQLADMLTKAPPEENSTILEVSLVSRGSVED